MSLNRKNFIEALAAEAVPLLSSVSLVEACMVLRSRKKADPWNELEEFMEEAGIRVVSVDAQQAKLAHTAFMRFGKGQHRASLNLGDCFSYALAKFVDQPLLFKGNDFSQTDVKRVI
ncbi:MAG: type II toxin-antitoxin system VapC family toxin [Acidobacteriaceae bacterium]